MTEQAVPSDTTVNPSSHVANALEANLLNHGMICNDVKQLQLDCIIAIKCVYYGIGALREVYPQSESVKDAAC